MWPFSKPTRDGTSIGRAAGTLLGDVLTAILDGKRPAAPIGMSRVGKELKKLTFGTLAEAGAWFSTPGLVDAIVAEVPADKDEVRIYVPAESNTAFDIIWTLTFVVDDKGLATSVPGFYVADGQDELLDDFNDGLAAGLELHPRTGEIKPGFGMLGELD